MKLYYIFLFILFVPFFLISQTNSVDMIKSEVQKVKQYNKRKAKRTLNYYKELVLELMPEYDSLKVVPGKGLQRSLFEMKDLIPKEDSSRYSTFFWTIGQRVNGPDSKISSNTITSAAKHGGNKELATYLINNLDNPIMDRREIYIALARMLVEPFHKIILEKYSYENWKKTLQETDIRIIEGQQVLTADAVMKFLRYTSVLKYIRSQESLLEYNKWMISPYYFVEYEDIGDIYRLAYRVHHDIIGIIGNRDFYPIYMDYSPCTKMRYSEKMIFDPDCSAKFYRKIYDWMVEYYGRYEITDWSHGLPHLEH